jgi:hypothetical protein
MSDTDNTSPPQEAPSSTQATPPADSKSVPAATSNSTGATASDAAVIDVLGPEDQDYTSTSDRSTHFVFHHKLFALPQAVFRMSVDKDPALEVQLGENKVLLPTSTVRKEFALDDKGKEDAETLVKVEKGLKFVREIRPDDSIPRELLDGTASWSVDPKHAAIAKGRVTVQLVSWMTGEESVIVDMAQLEQIAEDPMTRKRVNDAVTEICQRLDIPTTQRQTVLDRVDGLSRELAYIEALRDYGDKVKAIGTKLNAFSRAYHGDKIFWPEIQRMKALIPKPLEKTDGYFMQADAQTSEILVALKNYNSTINFVRDIRDEIHGNLMDWDRYITDMESMEVERLRANENKLRTLYGFLARTFPETKNWPLFSKQFKPATPPADKAKQA